jgi:lipopolysaccharide biosynthesis glycosyltransferase
MAVTMVSLFCNTRAAVTVHVICDDTITEDSRKKLTELTIKYNQNLEFHVVEKFFFEETALKLKHTSLKQNFSIGTLFRLKIAELLSLDKALYLDSDIVVNMDIQSLWTIDLDGYYAAAVKDMKATRNKIINRRHFKKMRLSTEQYFNAGVILFNLKKIREDMDLFNDSISFLIQHSKDAIFFDQDSLNSLLQKKTVFLQKEYNFIPVVLEHQKISDDFQAIIHFAGPKPWKYHCSPFDYLYWQYFTKTVWGDTIEKLLAAQKNITIDLGYAFYSGMVGSRRMLIGGFLFRIKKILNYYIRGDSSEKN